MSTIDLAPLFNMVIWPALSIVALSLAGFIAAKISSWTGSQNQERTRTLVNGILQSGLQAAQARVASSNMERIDVQKGIVSDALGYALQNGPTALKQLGIDITTPDGRLEVAQKLEALLAPAVMVAASSPVEVSVATAATIANPTVSTVPMPTTEVTAPASTQSVVEATAAAKPPNKVKGSLK